MQIYKFYKREIRSNPRPSEAHLSASFLPAGSESGVGNGGDSVTDYHHNYHHQVLPQGSLCSGGDPTAAASLHQHHLLSSGPNSLTPSVGQNASLICYSNSRGLPYGHGHHTTAAVGGVGTPYYYHLEDGTIVAYASPVHLDHHSATAGFDAASATASVTALPGTVVGTVVLATTATTLDADSSAAIAAVPLGSAGAAGVTSTTTTAAVMVEDSPPSYEMALLCPSVHSFMATSPPIQLIIPPSTKQLTEKVVVQGTSAKTVAVASCPVELQSQRTPSPVSKVTASAAGEGGQVVVVMADVMNSQSNSEAASAAAISNLQPNNETSGEAEPRAESEAPPSKSLPDSATSSEVVSTTSSTAG